MRRLPALAILFVAACVASAPQIEPTIVEARSPAVGPDGTVAAPVGLETLGGVFTPLLETGCPIPCEKKEIFSTASDNQDQVMIALYRGRVSMVRDATFLGRFQITGIPPMKRGEPQIEVTVAARGSDLVMQATDLQTSRPYKIVRFKD